MHLSNNMCCFNLYVLSSLNCAFFTNILEFYIVYYNYIPLCGIHSETNICQLEDKISVLSFSLITSHVGIQLPHNRCERDILREEETQNKREHKR